MASGKVVGIIHQVMYPGTSFATPDIRAGGSTPAESLLVHDFDAAADEFIDLLCSLNSYDGGGLTITKVWGASSATSGDVVWQTAIRRFQDDLEDIDAAHTYDFNTVTATAPSLSGEVSYDNITFTSGADMDSLANGELFILRVGRDADNVADTMTGDAELVGVVIKET